MLLAKKNQEPASYNLPQVEEQLEAKAADPPVLESSYRTRTRSCVCQKRGESRLRWPERRRGRHEASPPARHPLPRLSQIARRNRPRPDSRTSTPPTMARRPSLGPTAALGRGPSFHRLDGGEHCGEGGDRRVAVEEISRVVLLVIADVDNHRRLANLGRIGEPSPNRISRTFKGA